MTRKEYMDLLSRALENVEPEVARDIMEDYEAHFERAKESGRSDEEVIGELGSIEEFCEELDAFMTGKKSGEKKEKTKEENIGMRGAETSDAPTENPRGEENGTEGAQAAEEEDIRSSADKEEENDKQRREQAARELEHARAEMNRAFEEMKRAREELERAAKEQERVIEEQNSGARENMRGAEKEARRIAYEVNQDAKEIAKEAERAAREAAREAGRAAGEAGRAAARAGRRAGSFTYTQGSDLGNIVNDAKNIASDVLNMFSGVMDKAFSGFGDWMGSFEKSGEDMADYRRRQENARSEAAGYRSERSMGGVREENSEVNNDRYSYDYDENGGEEEQYMPEYSGVVRQEEGIRHVVVDSKSAEVDIRPSEDGTLFYRYINEGSAGSRIVYRCERRVSHDTMTLSIVRNEKVGRKNHSSILGGVFEENPDLRVELHLPKWLEALEVSGKSGDIEMEDIDIATLMLKSMSGDISMRGVNADKCMAETMSGDADVKNGMFGSVLASSKSGDVTAQDVKADKAAFKSMSGDAKVQNVEFGEAAVSSVSGDADACNVKSKIISVSSTSGDAGAVNLYAADVKISAISGDAAAEKVTSDHLLMTVASGDLQGNGLMVKVLKASAASGDMSIRGHADQMNLSSGSGDVIVVQNGDTKSYVNTRSGEVHFHLKNEGAGFAAKISTHGDTCYRYKDLQLQNAANGIHRYGMEGSSLEIQSTSGDITITD